MYELRRKRDGQKTALQRGALLSYLSRPRFASPDFAEQLTGTKAKLEVYDLDEKMLYFSIASDHFDNNTLTNLTEQSRVVEFGTQEGTSLTLEMSSTRLPWMNCLIFLKIKAFTEGH